MHQSLSPGSIWAYAYLIVPPLSGTRLSGLRTIVSDENRSAGRGTHTWNGRIVCERSTTHILIVSDSPAQKQGVNLRLEGEVKRLAVGFVLTRPMEIREYPRRIPPAAAA